MINRGVWVWSLPMTLESAPVLSADVTSQSEYLKARSLFIIGPLQEMVSQSESINTILDFWKKRLEIEDMVFKFFVKTPMAQGKLKEAEEWKDHPFTRAFRLWSESILWWDKQAERELRPLLFEKNILIRTVLYCLAKENKLPILWEKWQKDMMLIYGSWISTYLDKMAINWEESTPEERESFWPKRSPQNLVYGWAKDGKFVWYRAFLDTKIIPTMVGQIAQISNPHLRGMLLWTIQRIEMWDMEASSWLRLQWDHELATWDNKDSTIWVCGFMESYAMPGHTIDPEISLYLKEEMPDQVKLEWISLSQKYFWNDFGIWKLRIFVAEFLDLIWLSAFSKNSWRSFPNDVALTKEKGKHVYCIGTSFEAVFDSGAMLLSKIFKQNIKPDKEWTRRAFHDFLNFHELGHSLFNIADTGKDLGESKPSLFYMLKLFQDNMSDPNTWKKSRFEEHPEEIKHVIDELLINTVRDFERGYHNYKTNHMRPYVIFSRLFMRELLASGMIFWEWDTLQIDYNKEKFTHFLESMKWALERLKSIYDILHEDSEKDTEEDKNRYTAQEDAYVQEIESQTEADFQKICELIGVKK